MRTALVTGACGLLGQHLVNRLKSNYRVIAADIAADVFDKHENLVFISGDLTGESAFADIATRYKPDVIYNCAAFTDVDGCEIRRHEAYALNVELVINILDTGPPRLIQFSSDYVFSGEHGPYREDDPTDPLGYYGETKLRSERIIRESGGNHLVLRTNVLFGAGKNTRQNFVAWVTDNLKHGKQIKIATDQFNNPIHAANLAETSIEAEEAGLNGVLHLAGGSYLSRYEIAVRTAEFFDFDTGLITPVETSELGQTARRPMRGGLRIDLAKRLLKTRLLKFEEGLKLL